MSLGVDIKNEFDGVNLGYYSPKSYVWFKMFKNMYVT